jgi:ABC-2 type transport system ATP-binding protein
MTVTDTEAGTWPASGAAPLAVSLTGIHKNFGHVQAVKGVDLQIESGEIVAILGPNGAGKTSTIDIILGLSHPNAGEVTVYGMTPRKAISRGLVSAVMQTGGLLKDLTVAETVARSQASLKHVATRDSSGRRPLSRRRFTARTPAAALAPLDDCLSPQAKGADRTNTIIRRAI